MAANPLPHELFYEILGFAQDSLSTLKACTLVSRATLPFCRKLLFETFVISQNTVDVFLDEILASPSPGPDIALYIQEIIVQWVHIPYDIETKIYTAITSPALAERLPLLRCLIHGGIDWELYSFPDAVMNESISIPGLRITHLIVQCCYLYDIHQLLDALALCSTLVEIGIYSINLAISSVSPRYPEIQSRQLRVMRSLDFEAEVLVEWILAQRTLPDLQTLSLEYQHGRYLDQLFELGIALGRSLETVDLKISFPDSDDLFQAAHDAGFENNHNLLNLSLSVTGPIQMTIPFIVHLISHLHPSCSLKNLHLSVRISGTSHSLPPHGWEQIWDQLSSTLKQSQFSRLSAAPAFKVYAYNPKTLADLSALIQNPRLGNLVDRGFVVLNDSTKV